MAKTDGFYFIPKKWLGDANIIAMDWDCKSMHLHLMCIAWQQDPRGYLLDDENLLKKLLGNPTEEDWNNRIKPQVFSCWKNDVLEINGIKRKYWYQPGLLKNQETETIDKPKKPRKKKTGDLIEFDNPNYTGFNLEEILKAKPSATILHEASTQEERQSIWTIGVQILSKQDGNQGKARGFLAKLIKEYGDKAVAEAVAQLSLKEISPVEIHSYLVGILRKQQDVEKKKTGRGTVSL